MFRPNVAINHQVYIRKYGGTALQEWYGYVTMVRSQHLWCLLYAIYKGTGGGGVSVMCATLGVQLYYVCSLLSCVGLQLLFVHICCLLLVGFCYGLCVLSILCICGDLCVQSVLCVRVLVFHLGGVVCITHIQHRSTCSPRSYVLRLYFN